MRHPAFGEAIGGGYRPPTQIGVSYRKCQLFFPIFIKKQNDGDLACTIFLCELQ